MRHECLLRRSKHSAACACSAKLALPQWARSRPPPRTARTAASDGGVCHEAHEASLSNKKGSLGCVLRFLGFACDDILLPEKRVLMASGIAMLGLLRGV